MGECRLLRMGLPAAGMLLSQQRFTCVRCCWPGHCRAAAVVEECQCNWKPHVSALSGDANGRNFFRNQPSPHRLPQVRANLATALGVGPKQDLPPIMFQTEVADVSDQMGELAREGWPWVGVGSSSWDAIL